MYLIQVGVSVGVVGAEFVAGEVLSGGFVEAGGQLVGEAVAVVGVAAPAGGVVPFLAVAGGVHVDGDDDGLLDGVAYLAGELVGSAYAFLQGDVFFFGDQELGVVASELEVFHHSSGNFAVVLVLAEASVGRAFAGGVFPHGRSGHSGRRWRPCPWSRPESIPPPVF